MAGQAPTHRIQATHKTTKERIKLFAGWPSKNGKGVNLRPERDVRVTVEVTDKYGAVTTIDLADYWIDLSEFGERRASKPTEQPSGWGDDGKCKHGMDPVSCPDCVCF